MHEYKLLDSGNLRKLEQVGPYRIVRPAAACFWPPSLSEQEWQKKDAEFIRKAGEEGKWHFSKKALPLKWQITQNELKLICQLTSFGHLGFFPEHHKSNLLASQIEKFQTKKKTFSILNLFAYTGYLSSFAASKGALVTHVDASKTSLNWAKENAQLNKIKEGNIRFILDDVKAFVRREVKRKKTYQAIVLDPPSFGRGNKSQVWMIEKDLFPLLVELKKIMADDSCFFLLSCHSPGLTGEVLKNMLSSACHLPNSDLQAGEMTTAHSNDKRLLPAGSFCLWLGGNRENKKR